MQARLGGFGFAIVLLAAAPSWAADGAPEGAIEKVKVKNCIVLAPGGVRF